MLVLATSPSEVTVMRGWHGITMMQSEWTLGDFINVTCHHVTCSQITHSVAQIWHSRWTMLQMLHVQTLSNERMVSSRINHGRFGSGGGNGCIFTMLIGKQRHLKDDNKVQRMCWYECSLLNAQETSAANLFSRISEIRKNTNLMIWHLACVPKQIVWNQLHLNVSSKRGSFHVLNLLVGWISLLYRVYLILIFT